MKKNDRKKDDKNAQRTPVVMSIDDGGMKTVIVALKTEEEICRYVEETGTIRFADDP